MNKLILLSLFLLSKTLYADAPPGVFSYQGKIYKSNGLDPVNSSSVTITIQIYAPDGACLLFQETHMRNMSSSNGNFSLNIGHGTNANVSGLTLMQAFDNSTAKTGSAGCSYTPTSGDSRRLRFSYDDGVEALTMSTDQLLQSVPYAWSAYSLAGLTKDKFLQVSSVSTQFKVDQVFTRHADLMDLLNGSAAAYAKSSDLPMSAGVLNLSSGGVRVANVPSSNDSAVNKNYSDSKLGGMTLDLTGVSNGQTISWNAAQSKWQVSPLTAGTVTSVTAGTGLSGGAITSSGTISMPNVGTVGTYTKVTTDAQGRVASGTSLTSADIPNPAGDVSGTHSATQVIKIRGVMVSTTAPSNNQVLKYNSASTQWEPSADTSNAGTVTSVSVSSPLAVVNASTTPALSFQDGMYAGQVLRWSGSAWVYGFPNIADLRNSAATYQFPTTTCGSSKTLSYTAISDTYSCVDIAISNTQVSGLGTAAALNVGTAANRVVQLDASARLPAVDGSQLLNLPIPFSNMEVLSTPTVAGSWPVPANVRKIYVQVWGAGGGGGGGTALLLAGGGGGAGAYSAGFLTVTPGDSIAYAVGSGGGGGAVNDHGVDGTLSQFGPDLVAAGGNRGLKQAAASATGGASSGVYAKIKVSGGSGGTPGPYLTAIGSIGGMGGAAGGGGGGGGAAASLTSSGGVGVEPGGGGGGGSSVVLSATVGGAGANGRIVIWY